MRETVDLQDSSLTTTKFPIQTKVLQLETLNRQRKVAAEQDKRVMFLNFSLFSPSVFYTFY